VAGGFAGRGLRCASFVGWIEIVGLVERVVWLSLLVCLFALEVHAGAMCLAAGGR